MIFAQWPFLKFVRLDWLLTTESILARYFLFILFSNRSELVQRIFGSSAEWGRLDESVAKTCWIFSFAWFRPNPCLRSETTKAVEAERKGQRIYRKSGPLFLALLLMRSASVFQFGVWWRTAEREKPSVRKQSQSISIVYFSSAVCCFHIYFHITSPHLV